MQDVPIFSDAAWWGEVCVGCGSIVLVGAPVERVDGAISIQTCVAITDNYVCGGRLEAMAPHQVAQVLEAFATEEE